jgi:glycosyltransferase involved in cell wall biosynthesis
MLNHILFDCERMKYPNTGLYEFCLQLGNALREEIAEEKLSFYLPEKQKTVFGENESVLIQKSLHKFFLPCLKGINIWHSTFQGTMYYPFAKNLKVVLTVHDLNFLYEENVIEIEKEKHLKRLQTKIDRADYIVAISQFVMNDLKKHLYVENKQMSVIYNGCSINTLTTVLPNEVKVKNRFLFTIGTIATKKNFHVLPPLLLNNSFSLVIAGVVVDELYKKRIIAEAEKFGVADRLIFTGAISENDKNWYLKNCLAFVFPSIAEGFGLPVIEAMYFGKLVILSRATSLPEIGSDCAYYFEDFEPQNMQQVFARSLVHYENLPSQQRIKERAVSFSWTNAAKDYLKIYKGLSTRYS